MGVISNNEENEGAPQQQEDEKRSQQAPVDATTFRVVEQDAEDSTVSSARSRKSQMSDPTWGLSRGASKGETPMVATAGSIPRRPRPTARQVSSGEAPPMPSARSSRRGGNRRSRRGQQQQQQQQRVEEEKQEEKEAIPPPTNPLEQCQSSMAMLKRTGILDSSGDFVAPIDGIEPLPSNGNDRNSNDNNNNNNTLAQDDDDENTIHIGDEGEASPPSPIPDRHHHHPEEFLIEATLVEEGLSTSFRVVPPPITNDADDFVDEEGTTASESFVAPDAIPQTPLLHDMNHHQIVIQAEKTESTDHKIRRLQLFIAGLVCCVVVAFIITMAVALALINRGSQPQQQDAAVVSSAAPTIPVSSTVEPNNIFDHSTAAPTASATEEDYTGRPWDDPNAPHNNIDCNGPGGFGPPPNGGPSGGPPGRSLQARQPGGGPPGCNDGPSGPGNNGPGNNGPSDGGPGNNGPGPGPGNDGLDDTGPAIEDGNDSPDVGTGELPGDEPTDDGNNAVETDALLPQNETDSVDDIALMLNETVLIPTNVSTTASANASDALSGSNFTLPVSNSTDNVATPILSPPPPG
ncbi:expressed unknown protein [Seminavis robusta]|uniref:Uncharacterized protein n=1 Tax=Seminavis robusta TaxID=568900 RepID=A0A9N8DVS5_9STRA|nr:expressed unknown protein [Seminavis robusta]|eukprot:Sro330_g118980.1 n/a (576) ;mRNA; r:58966-60776